MEKCPKHWETGLGGLFHSEMDGLPVPRAVSSESALKGHSARCA